MRTPYKRHSKLETKLDKTKDYVLTIDGFEVTIEFSHHSIGRSWDRSVYDHALVLMIRRAFDEILDIKRGERFIIIDKELCISMVGGIETAGTDIIISVISAIDSDQPHNPRNTLEIVI